MISEEKQRVLSLFAEGRKLYKMMDFAGARKYFGEALKTDPNDGPSRIYYLRCQHYVENPPPEDWDGVWVMKTK